jgi:hypothetical protein
VDWQLDYQSLPGGKDKGHLRLVREVLIDSGPGTGSGGKAVVVEDYRSARHNARIDEVAAVFDGPVKVHVDMSEGYAMEEASKPANVSGMNPS